MNIIIILVAVVAFIVSLIFSTRLQTAVFQTLQLAGVIAQGVWNRVAPRIAGVANGVAGAIPTVRGMFMTILRTAWQVARFFLIALLILWALNLAVFLGIGFAVNAEWSGLFLGIFIPMASIFWILRRFPVIGEVIRVPMVAAIVIIIMAAPFFATGVFSPDIKGSLNRLAENQERTIVNTIDNSSLKLELKSEEVKVGVVATLFEETVLYNNNKKAVWRMPSGTRIMIMDIKGYPQYKRVEGMAMVMIENKYGDFVDGNIVFVPNSKIRL